MPRHARVIIPGLPYHITQRGNGRQQVFFTEADYLKYLALLRMYTDQFQVDVLGYCLMPNHPHLVAIPHEEDSLARALGLTHQRYTQMFNATYRRTGLLWQGRFHACALDEEHFWRALRYVELNSKRANLVSQAWDYLWSSAAAHTGGVDRHRLLKPIPWADGWDAQAWRELLTLPEDDDFLATIRRHTRDGTPLGSSEFCRQFSADCLH
jgi:putative transposase